MRPQSHVTRVAPRLLVTTRGPETDVADSRPRILESVERWMVRGKERVKREEMHVEEDARRVSRRDGSRTQVPISRGHV